VGVRRCAHKETRRKGDCYKRERKGRGKGEKGEEESRTAELSPIITGLLVTIRPKGKRREEGEKRGGKRKGCTITA